MSKPTSMAPSPTSQQHYVNHPTSSNQLNIDSTDAIRVTFSQSNSTGNHVINFTGSMKNSIEENNDADVEQPLLTKQPLSKSS